MHCKKNKFIYVHLPKCAGTFVKHFLLSNMYDDYEENTDLQRYQKEHDTLGERPIKNIKKIFPGTANLPAYVQDRLSPLWDSCFKFTIVRNPWDRVASMYNFLGGWKYNRIITTGEEREMLPQIEPFHRFYSECDFDGFVDYSFAQGKIKDFHRGYFETYIHRLSLDGKLAIDEYYKLEDIDYMIDDLCNRLNFKSKKIFTDWRKNSSAAFKQEKHHMDYYSDWSKEVISNHFREDINFFGYQHAIQLSYPVTKTFLNN